MSEECLLYIGGEWVRSGSGRTFASTDPATGEQVATLQEGTPDDVDRAVAAATAVAPRLRRSGVETRAGWCEAVAGAIEAQAGPLARALSAEQGKPLHEAEAEVATAALGFRAAAGHVRHLDGTITPVSDPDKRVLSRRVARGVYAVVTPWNFPVNIPTEYLAPALATGNAVVWVPAPTTGHVAVLLTRIIASVGLPAGALNLVTGPGPVVGDAAVAHPDVHGVGFTGSSATGAHIARRAAGKAQLLELGGNGPTIVLDDADLEAAADAIAGGAFFNAGQTCAATEVVLVERGVHDELARLLAERAGQVVLGAGTDGDTTMGPLNNDGVATKMDDHVADALERGATKLTGGGRRGLFYEATVLCDVAPQARLVREESFGPIVPLVPVDSAEAALEIASGPEFGLVASVWSRSARRAFAVAEELRTGIVNINDSSTWWEIHVPFGGGSGTLSGTGRLGGMHTLLEMTEIKTITFATSAF